MPLGLRQRPCWSCQEEGLGKAGADVGGQPGLIAATDHPGSKNFRCTVVQYVLVSMYIVE